MIDKSEGFKDAPPSYQHVLQSSSTTLADSKSDPRLGAGPNPDATLSSHTTTGTKRHYTKVRTKATNPSRWLPTSIFGLSKTAKQVRGTTQSLLRDLLSQARPSEHEWLSVLTSCAEACDAQGLSFSAVLQEPFVEGHLPVYWAVLKRPVLPIKIDHMTPTSDPDTFVMAILDASLPLNAQSVADARLACMTVSDNALFVRLGQRYEAFSPRVGPDKVLLGGADTVDSVTVDEPHNSSGAFTVHFSLTQFPLRMRVSKSARVEFIARGRLWQLVFAVAGAPGAPHLNPGHVGEWLISLSLSEPSSPAWVDARLSIVDRSLPPPPSAPDPPQTTPRLRGLPLPPKHPNQGKQRPTVSLPIKTGIHQISPNGPLREIVVSLEKFTFGTTLQNDASSYVDMDGALNAQLEVKLQKSSDTDSNCIIC
ncbi:hypothetical protein BJY52DRAFT_218228 [Lactarius psammicola]|nr:hypothetical protein BJY52DRAFT_218228 [Lactarius psammicola]